MKNHPIDPHPPRWAKWIGERLVHAVHEDEVLGDLEEDYVDLAQAHGSRYANRWYWRQILYSLPHFIGNALYWNTYMLENYCKVAFRTLRKNKAYTFINVAGLTMSMACCLLIFLYIYDEYSYDRFHDHADRTYRLVYDYTSSDGKRSAYIATPEVLLPHLQEEYPDIEAATGFLEAQTFHFFKHGAARFAERNYYFIDSTFFEVFSFPFLHGDQQTAAQYPQSAILTRSTAQRYFGDQDPIGQTFTRDVGQGHVYTVTGVVEDVPAQSHFHFDFLLTQPIPGYSKYTYVRLREGTTLSGLTRQVQSLAGRVLEGVESNRMQFEFQPLTDIHLYSQRYGELGPNTDVRYLYIFAAIALLILSVACINFVNLATARSTKRSREIGMRKVLGAHRSQLIKQFLGESTLTSVIALPLAILLVEVLLPVFNQVSGKTLDAAFYSSPVFWLVCLGLLLTIGMIGGSYPAFILSAIKPVSVFKGKAGSTGKSGKTLRNALVMIQFGISVLLIIGALTIQSQMQYIQDKNLGFDQEQLIVLEGTWALGDEARYSTFRNALLQNASIDEVARTSIIPGRNLHAQMVSLEDNSMAFRAVEATVTPRFADVLGLDVLAGRSFALDSGADLHNAVMVNESLVNQLGWDQPLGKSITVDRWSGGDAESTTSTLDVIGVVNDAHFASLRQSVEPMLFTLPLHYRGASYTYVRTKADRVRAALAHIQQTWDTFLPNRHFEFSFADERLRSLYESERRLGILSTAFTLLSVFVACLGLIGLAAFTAQQRTREIGVRKVLGATVSDIVLLLTKDVARLILFAFVLASPLAYLIVDRWLQNFAYRVDVGWSIFLMAGLIVPTIAFFAIGSQCLRAALANPARTLRHE